MPFLNLAVAGFQLNGAHIVVIDDSGGRYRLVLDELEASADATAVHADLLLELLPGGAERAREVEAVDQSVSEAAVHLLHVVVLVVIAEDILVESEVVGVVVAVPARLVDTEPAVVGDLLLVRGLVQSCDRVGVIEVEVRRNVHEADVRDPGHAAVDGADEAALQAHAPGLVGGTGVAVSHCPRLLVPDVGLEFDVTDPAVEADFDRVDALPCRQFQSPARRSAGLSHSPVLSR